MATQNMRPKFNADTCYIPVHESVYLRNNHSGLVLKGKSLYHLLEHLAPNLKGNSTLEEITEGLDQDRKRMVTKLIEKLFAHHFLKDASQDQLHTLLPAVQEAYASTLTFIDSFPTATAPQFARFRTTRLLLIGSGSSFASLVQACLQCGVRQIGVLITAESTITSNSLDQCSTYDPEQMLQAIDAPDWDNESEVRHMLQGYDAILHLSEQPMLARAQQLNRLCVEQQKLFIQAIVVDDHAWIGPLVSPDADGCWECAWRRLQANLTYPLEQRLHYAFHDQPALTSQFLTLPMATMAANRLIFELFKHLTQTGFAKTAEMLTEIDLKTFLSKSHTFLPHPLCLACQHAPATPFREQIQQREQPGPIDPETLFERIGRCVDERLGLFTEVGDDNFVQTPLAVYRVRLSNPLPTPDLSKPLDVIATSTDTINSRVRACQKACERYAAHLVDQRRLFSHETVQQSALPVIASEHLIGMPDALPAVEAWIGALDLHAQRDVYVPATLAFSSLHSVEHERGIASGTSWEEAVSQALLDWCNDLTVAQLSDAQSPYARVDLASTPMTAEGSYLLHLLEVAGKQITVYDVTGPLHVPTFALCAGKKVVAYRTHCDIAQALSMGFEQVLQQYQAEHYQQPEYAIAPVPDLPLALRSEQMQVPRYPTVPDTWATQQEWLLQQLEANGLHALAVPLDHDPALQQVLPFIVRVLLSRAEVQHGS